MKKYLRSYLPLLMVAGFIIILDQTTKVWVRNSLDLGEMWSPWPWLAPYARIVHWYNTGVVFGLFQEQGQFFAVLAVIIALAILYYYPRVPASDWTLRLAMGLQLGGAIGNLIDRLTVKHVTDFISVGSFPVFNIADSSITIGVGVLLLGIWLQEKQSRSERKDIVEAQSTVDPGSNYEG